MAVPFARLRFASLWLSQTSRTFADNCLRMYVLLEVARIGQQESQAAWHLVAVFFIAPFIVLAPINGALSNSLLKRWLLTVSAAFGACMTLAIGLIVGNGGDSWVWCLGLLLVMLGAAVYNPTRYAILPAVAHDTHIPLSRVNGWIEMGGALGLVLGLVLGVFLHDLAWTVVPPVAVSVTAGLYLIAALAALPVEFPSDVRREEAPMQAVLGFFRDCRRIVREPRARGSLLGLVCFLALIVAGSGAILAYHGGLSGGVTGGHDRGTLIRVLVCASIGGAVGSLLAGRQGHPQRVLGLVPFGATGLLLALGWAALKVGVEWPSVAIGITTGLVNVPLRATYQAAVPADARGNGMAVLNTAYYLLAAVLSVLLVGFVHLGLPPAGQLWIIAVLAAAGVAVSWRLLLRDSVEQVVEWVVRLMYRIRVHGPGLDNVPLHGPAIVIANHSAWLDPFWLAILFPRHMYPMMTSGFFDLPGVHFLMAHVAHAIRVPDARFRRETPEIDEAIKVLDQGKCLLVFPEGYLRRREDVPLRRFGQGIWRILSQRPATPVVVCWIEGGWGSFTSFRNGPPMRNKRIEIRRPIDIGICDPQIIDPSILLDQHETRRHLMQLCLDARSYLGLEPLTKQVLNMGEDEEVEETAESANK